MGRQVGFPNVPVPFCLCDFKNPLPRITSLLLTRGLAPANIITFRSAPAIHNGTSQPTLRRLQCHLQGHLRKPVVLMTSPRKGSMVWKGMRARGAWMDKPENGVGV